MEIRDAYCPICDKSMWLVTNDTIVCCPYCNHHLNLRPSTDTPIEDCLTVVFDYNPPDMPVMVIAREDGEKIKSVNSLIGNEALEVYKKLVGNKGTKEKPV